MCVSCTYRFEISGIHPANALGLGWSVKTCHGYSDENLTDFVHNQQTVLYEIRSVYIRAYTSSGKSGDGWHRKRRQA